MLFLAVFLSKNKLSDKLKIARCWVWREAGATSYTQFEVALSISAAFQARIWVIPRKTVTTTLFFALALSVAYHSLSLAEKTRLPPFLRVGTQVVFLGYCFSQYPVHE